ncbi:MAG TPA: hypothetical protein VJ417_04380, partial [Candidatus Glassbacteria bacterium]|nr:hypothetical protein [Candidatus Glassbacteria bacterium]
MLDTNSGFTISSAYKVRAYDTTLNYTVGESDFFTFKGGLGLTAPAGGVKWSMDAPQQISWTTTGTFTYGVRLRFSTDSTNGTNGTWTVLSAYPTSADALASTNILTNADNNGITAASAWWLPSEDLAGGEANLWIKVSDANTSTPPSAQAAAITVSDIASVNFTLPDRAATAVKVGADLSLNITSTGVTNVTIEYKSNDGGGSYVVCRTALDAPATDIAVSGLPFVWRVPDDVFPSAGADIRVSASASSSVVGTLQQTFSGVTIYGGLTRTQPVSGTYKVNDPTDRVPIVWSGSSSIGAITFEYNLDAVSPNWQNAAVVGVGDIYSVSTGGTAGTYNWAGGSGTAWWQPKFTTGGVYIRVVDSNDTATYSPVNLATEAFSISGISVLGVTATSSFGDITYLDTLTVGTTRYIKGTGTTPTGTVNLYYDTEQAFPSPVPIGTVPLTSGAYVKSWTVPDVISDTVYFKVTDPSDENVVYSVTAVPVSILGGLSVNTPGGAWVVGSTANSVTGTVTGDIDVVDLQFTTAASPSENDWTNAAAGLSIGNNAGTTSAAFTVPAGSFTVPDAVSAANFKIRVKDATVGRAAGILAASAASAGFQVKGLFSVTSPSGADTWYAGKDADVNYNATGSGLGNFRIYYGYRKSAAAS